MVKLEEVEDETYLQTAGADDEEAWDTDDSASEVSDISELSEPEAETLTDRFLALRDMVPPASRRRIASTYNTSYSWGSWGLSGGLKLAWQVSVSVLLVVVPYSLAWMEEMQITQAEEEQKMKEMGNEMMTQGADDTSLPLEK